MRARPPRIMAEIRKEYELSVRDAWQVYREFRDVLKESGAKPSLAALGREEQTVKGIVEEVTAPPPEDFYDDGLSDYDYDYEITVAYEG